MAIKKTHYFLFLLTAFFFANLVNAQKAPAPSESTNANFYVKVYAGYGLITPGSYLVESSTSSSGGSNSSFSTNNIGLGAGLHYGGGIGYIVNDFLNLGIDAEYLNGKKLTSNSTYTSDPSNYYAYTQTIKHSVLSIIPNVTFKALSKPSYYIYNRIGILLAVNTKLDITNTDTSSYISGVNTYKNNYIDVQKLKFGLNIGVQAALGVQFSITDNIRGFAELVGNYLPVKPNSSAEVSTGNSNVNGTLTTSISNYNYTYKKSGNYNSTSMANTTGGYDYTGNQPSVTYNINYLGVNIGVAVKF